MTRDRDFLKKLFESVAPTCLGAHFSIAGGIHQALITAKSYGCTAVQLFTKSATTWKERRLTDEDIRLFKQAVNDTGIRQIAAHTSYLINLATPDRDKRAKSINALTGEMIRSDALGIPFVILHPGAHMKSGLEKGMERIVTGVNDVISRNPDLSPRLLFETTAGQGTGIGHRFEHLAQIISRIEAKEQVGVCLDTCHIFAAGYDIRTIDACRETMRRFADTVGWPNLYFLHLNDSLKGFGSRVDRHAHIGQGSIGMEGFRYFMTEPRLATIPKVIETPKGSDDDGFDLENLARLLELIIEDKKINEG